jgi:hypothetical protein
MGALPQPPGSNQPSRPKLVSSLEQQQIRDTSTIRRVLEAVTLVLGPGIVADWILHILGLGKFSQPVALGVAVLCAVALYKNQIDFRYFLTRRRSVIPWSIVVALSMILFIFVHRPLDRWTQWQHAVDKAVLKCGDNSNECVSTAVAKLAEQRPMSEGVSKNSSLLADLLSGQLLLQNASVAKLLDSKLSVNERFIGSGFAMPAGSQDFAAARAPEYFVRNLHKTSKRVWTWQQKNPQDILDKPLKEVLSAPPVANGQDSFSLDQPHLDPEDKTPTLVRFALLKPGEYKGCLGKPTASHVFMMSLGSALQMGLTVRRAVTFSGHNVVLDPTHELFIWVYKPMSEQDAVPATWGNILKHLDWTAESGCALLE